MPLLSLLKAPRLYNEGNVMQWSRDLSDYLDRRTGQLVLPFDVVQMVDSVANEDVPLPAATLIGVVGPGTGFFVGGLTGGVLGRLIILMNYSGQNMAIIEADTNSQPVNQIFNYGLGNFAANVVMLVHLGDNGSWAVVGSR